MLRSICQPIYVPTCENVGWGLAVICAVCINIYLKENQLLFWQKSVANNLDHTHQDILHVFYLFIMCNVCTSYKAFCKVFFLELYIFKLHCDIFVKSVQINYKYEFYMFV